MDVGFLIDSSGSINAADKHNFQRIRDFIKGFIKAVVIGENDTRIALATYSGSGNFEPNFKVRFNFTAYSTTESLMNAVQSIPYDSGSTYTGGALTRMRTDVFSAARQGLPAILIVLTDGKSHDSVKVPASRLRDTGVHIISVGVGDAMYSELADMASDPDNGNIFDVTFASLVNLLESFLPSVCKGE